MSCDKIQDLAARLGVELLGVGAEVCSCCKMALKQKPAGLTFVVSFRHCQWMLPSLLPSRTRWCLSTPGLLCHPLIPLRSPSPAFWLVYLLLQFSDVFPDHGRFLISTA